MILTQTTGETTEADLFSAARIACCLTVSPQAVRKKLRNVPASGVRCIAGNETAAWSFASLPENIRFDLQATAKALGYRSALEMLSNLPAPKLGLALSEVCDADISYAKKLRSSLAVALAQQNNLEIQSSEIEATAVCEFQKQFFYTVTPRHIRNLIKRTLARDGGLENWDRLELYLPDHPRRKDAARPVRTPGEFGAEFDSLKTCISDLPNPTQPDREDLEIIWDFVWATRNKLIGDGLCDKKANRTLREFLSSHAQFLAPSRDALLKTFTRKLEAHNSGEPFDKRQNNTGNHDGYEFPKKDFIRLVALSAGRGGRITQAWRFGIEHKEFTAETLLRYAGKSKSKSHVPHSILEAVRPQVDYEMKRIRGDRTTGYTEADDSKLSSLIVISGDDVTPNNYFFIPTEDGFKLLRGQWLVFICVRSLCVLHHCLIPKESYNSVAIWSALTKTFKKFGTPNVLHFEFGIWEKSKLITGSDARSLHEVTRGLSEFGIRFQHATTPEAKGRMENVIGKLQNRMEIERGYCGRNERLDCPEATKRQMAAVRSGRAHPSEYFYSFEEWNSRLGLIVNDYNNEVQQGGVIPNLSPIQALEKFKPVSDPRHDFGPEIQFLLSNHKVETTCTANGVTITLNGERLNYKGSEIAHFTGRRVIIWINPEDVETAFVTDFDRTPETMARVERSQKVNRYAETEHDKLVLATQLRRVREQIEPLKTLHNTIKIDFEIPKRRTFADGQTLELGRRFEKAKEIDETRSRIKKSEASATHRISEKLGIELPRAVSKQAADYFDKLSQSDE